MMEEKINKYIEIIEKAIDEEKSDPIIILAARYLISEFDTEYLPKWLLAIANLNI